MKRFATRLAACAGLIFLAACPSRALPTVKYEFTRNSSSVTATGSGACPVPTLYRGTEDIHYYDSLVAGTTVTFQNAFYCQDGASSLTVNGSAVTLAFGATGSCCTLNFQTFTTTITTQYDSGAPSKLISFAPGGALMPLTGAMNAADPFFRINITMIPGPGVGSATGTFTNSVTPTFYWPAMPTAGMYQLQVSADPFFASPVIDAGAIPSTSFTVGTALVNGNTYYARVRTSAGPYNGAWSYITDFTVAQTAPSTPVLVSPANPSNVPVQTPTFNWNPVTLGSE